MNWERRKQSEKWVREKSNEFCKTNSDLTFAEWCYQQGRADERAKVATEILTDIEHFCKDNTRQSFNWVEVWQSLWNVLKKSTEQSIK